MCFLIVPWDHTYVVPVLQITTAKFPARLLLIQGMIDTCPRVMIEREL